ncbi:hypothetical protein D1007_39512 [Hordeum vulgare]|nr:hypothetical protein D1007_39512 [Hordeum vulgare]
MPRERERQNRLVAGLPPLATVTARTFDDIRCTVNMYRAASMAKGPRGTWEGIIVMEEHIDNLRHCRMLPPAELVAARVPAGEGSPAPQAGEMVVFLEHFFRGFGLLASDFYNSFLVHYGLQPHHLAANVMLQLAAYVSLCEAFLGIEPRLDLWRPFFYFNQKSVLDDTAKGKKMSNYDGALVHHRTAFGFLKLPVQDSVKKWQKGFFYMCDPHDPCRLSAKELRPSKVAERVNLISSASMDESGAWGWGEAPYNRNHPSPKPATDRKMSDPEEIEDLGEVQPQSADSDEVEEVAESEGTEPTFAPEDLEELEDVSSPPERRHRRAIPESAEGEEGARRKGKRAVAAKPAPKHAAGGPPAGALPIRGVVRRALRSVKGGEVSDTEQAAWADVDPARQALAKHERHQREEEAKKASAGRDRVEMRTADSALEAPSRERRSKTRHDPALQRDADARADDRTRASSRVAGAAEEAEPVTNTMQTAPEAKPKALEPEMVILSDRQRPRG